MEKPIGILTQICPPNSPSMETPCNSDSPKLPAQGQTSQAIQIHHMASKQMPRDREIWSKPLEFWLKPVHLMHQAWKHHAILIHQSCHKCQACHKCWPSYKHNGNLKAVTNVAQAENTTQFWLQALGREAGGVGVWKNRDLGRTYYK